MRPETREIDYKRYFRIVDTGLLDKAKLKTFLENGSQLPIVVTQNFGIYYGAMYHDQMVRDWDDILFQGYAKYANGKVIISQGPHHQNREFDSEMIEAAEEMLASEFEKHINN